MTQDELVHTQDPEPDIMACLIHDRQPALHTYQVKEIHGEMILRYGLCPWCSNKLKHDKTYAVHIDKRLCERLEKLNQGEKCKNQL